MLKSKEPLVQMETSSTKLTELGSNWPARAHKRENSIIIPGEIENENKNDDDDDDGDDDDSTQQFDDNDDADNETTIVRLGLNQLDDSRRLEADLTRLKPEGSFSGRVKIGLDQRDEVAFDDIEQTQRARTRQQDRLVERWRRQRQRLQRFHNEPTQLEDGDLWAIE